MGGALRQALARACSHQCIPANSNPGLDDWCLALASRAPVAPPRANGDAGDIASLRDIPLRSRMCVRHSRSRCVDTAPHAQGSAGFSQGRRGLNCSSSVPWRCSLAWLEATSIRSAISITSTHHTFRLTPGSQAPHTPAGSVLCGHGADGRVAPHRTPRPCALPSHTPPNREAASTTCSLDGAKGFCALRSRGGISGACIRTGRGHGRP